MSETQISRTHREPMARSAIWFTCPDCGDTRRVLAVMASRVLEERRECPQCLSLRAPCLRQTEPGAHIAAPEAPLAAMDEDEQAELQAWIDDHGRSGLVHHWFSVLLSRLRARFSRAKPVQHETTPDAAIVVEELGLPHSENDIL